MKTLPLDPGSLPPQHPSLYNYFERFDGQGEDYYFVETSFFDDEKILRQGAGKDIAYFEIEEPNRFFLGAGKKFPPNEHGGSQSRYRNIFTLCPFTAEWLNARIGRNQRIPVFLPCNEQTIPPPNKKTIDVVYAGNIIAPEIEKTVQTISHFNYRLISNSQNPLVTDQSASHEAKLELMSRSKVAVVHNLLYPNPIQVRSLWQVPGYRDNRAFSLIPRPLPAFVPGRLAERYIQAHEIIVPQVKQRLFEAAFCRSLILCRKDPFNLVERFFAPNQEFVYYEQGRLFETLTEVLENFDQYTPVVERAYERALREYTTKAFFNTYLKALPPLSL